MAGASDASGLPKRRQRFAATLLIARNPASDTRGMKRDDVMSVVNLRASMVAAQHEYDELELSDNVTPSGEVLPLTAHEEFVIRRYAAISLMYHQAVHRYYGLAERVPAAGKSALSVLDLELSHS
jgi:hypothetical protein